MTDKTFMLIGFPGWKVVDDRGSKLWATLDEAKAAAERALNNPYGEFSTIDAVEVKASAKRTALWT